MGSCCTAAVVPDPPKEDEILQDLEQSEEKVWRIAFAQIDPEHVGHVGTDHELLRHYLMQASALNAVDDLERGLALQCKDGRLNFEDFVCLLRNHAWEDTMSINTFQQMSGSAETVECTVVRSELRRIGNPICDSFSEELWDRLLNVVMCTADFTVDLEWWLLNVRVFVRYVRCLSQAKTPFV